jgi:hypothetical protein
MALHLNLTSCCFSMKLKVLFWGVVVSKVPLTSEVHSGVAEYFNLYYVSILITHMNFQ